MHHSEEQNTISYECYNSLRSSFNIALVTGLQLQKRKSLCVCELNKRESWRWLLNMIHILCVICQNSNVIVARTGWTHLHWTSILRRILINMINTCMTVQQQERRRDWKKEKKGKRHKRHVSRNRKKKEKRKKEIQKERNKERLYLILLFPPWIFLVRDVGAGGIPFDWLLTANNYPWTHHCTITHMHLKVYILHTLEVGGEQSHWRNFPHGENMSAQTGL